METTASPAVRFDSVSKRFGRTVAVNRLSFAIPRGCIYGFLGPNGSGKTTTIRMIMSILKPDEGDISVLGVPDALAVKDRLGYLPEERGLYKKMKVLDILVYFGRLKGVDGRTAKQRALELLERHGLGDRASQRCEALSKGLGQKIQILATLIHEPELIILDEPFSGLDPVNVDVMRDSIQELKARDKTIIFSTHMLDQAERICDSILLIHRGEKLLDGPLRDVKRTGQLAVHLDYDGPPGSLGGLPGVASVRDEGKTAELRLEDHADPQAVLRELVDRVTVRRFDTREPSLHEIFVRRVKATGGEDAA